MFPGLESPMQWLAVGIVALLVLDPRRRVGIARALGADPREFERALGGGVRSDVAERERASACARVETPAGPRGAGH